MLLIKVGGGKDVNWDNIAADPFFKKGRAIVVHGANYFMEETLRRLGISSKVIHSPSGQISRYTDREVMEVMTMVYSGLVNKRAVMTFQKNGINAIGVSGADGRIWQGVRKQTIYAVEEEKTKMVSDSLTGKVVSVNHRLLTNLMESKYLPVLTVPAISDKGELINVDNDRAVAVMVRDLKIREVVMLFEAPGLLAQSTNEDSLIKRIKKGDIDTFLGQTSGRMKKKLLGIKEALNYGAGRIYLSDGRIKNPVTRALQACGTVIE
ncbi:MAG: acetylglutamate kinase, acetylglutamate/LysW-gamma-L-alpha-aminoadipate kinase [Candidatus Gottesmanbacteria bacterium GW2011_GWA2_43_14]|uniref:Acetylglutamate kinase, acetylglutamate/LysW-gamma-L-alpha-aminoadipate kinase n=1 Tax=Candidatus Gottesmanbacteria bacterium GW2011_GWA2_43_14 TaxID=1618443 RepID=A0A0G1FUS8_9BACT|nr:MAG: acetylglutamate kinase, acetylglutamate/LysW-gamma-L-alpha-aminoadipate kinase [Candidatus Gottesmanbacteria bacterium GW2011_GWA2_43_14]